MEKIKTGTWYSGILYLSWFCTILYLLLKIFVFFFLFIHLNRLNSLICHSSRSRMYTFLTKVRTSISKILSQYLIPLENISWFPCIIDTYLNPKFEYPPYILSTSVFLLLNTRFTIFCINLEIFLTRKKYQGHFYACKRTVNYITYFKTVRNKKVRRIFPHKYALTYSICVGKIFEPWSVYWAICCDCITRWIGLLSMCVF
jgi:hypothetical protein